MDAKQSILKEFLQLMTAAFTCTVLVMSIIGWFAGDAAEGTTAIFNLGSAGLSYQIIFQIVIFSVMNSSLTLLISIILRKLMFLWQMIIIMFVCLITSGIFAATFRWIPLDSWAAWLWFVLSFVGMFIAIATALVIKTWLADKRYEKLLADYKDKQKKEIL